MERVARIFVNVIFCIQILLTFLLFFEDRIALPPWLQVAGRLHPLVLHLPIGFFIFLAVIIIFKNQLEAKSAERIIHLGLLFTSFVASMAALFGFFLSLQDDYGNDALTNHKVTGVLLSWFCYTLLIWNRQQRNKKLFYGLGAITFLALIVAGHTGAELTHGENFVLAPISSAPKLTMENASVYEFAVQPILDKKCFSCHNEAKAKGGLVMTSVEKFQKGGKNGEAFIAGKPSESRMIKALYLPMDHDEHMPPDGKPQLTSVERATIEAWIKSGADFEKRLDQFADGDSLKFIVASFAASNVTATEIEKQYDFPAVSLDVVENLNTPFRSVFPLHQNSPALQVDFFLKESFQTSALEELKTIAKQLVVLNLSKMPVTDKDLAIISGFINVEALNLNFTKVQGPGLKDLQKLKNLRSLSLAGTSIKTDDLEHVLNLSNLREVYIWNTQITEADRVALSKKYPDVELVGELFSEEKILKLGKPRVENDGVIRRGDLIALKHNMPGVAVSLGKNGSEPDSINGELYKAPFTAEETFVLKAKACKKGWYCSDVLEVTCFVEGISPTNAELLSPADPQYKGKGGEGLIDLQKGFADIFKESSWLGYRDQPFAAAFDFGKEISLNKIVISYGKNIGGYIFPPEAVEVWAGKSLNDLTLLTKANPSLPTGYTPNTVEALPITINAKVPYRFYKIVAKPLAKLPAWHNSKGEKGWFFLDEVFFY
ncbi:c-type cytochrome domain-containing protein [Chryseolinea sp. H1M3-3]|uniref:c-type cytochrome domain-containing protein n=1 Tax=Chryseolinea sp. H1M3-3 TaxID=3034144 RepID=UPI0023ED7989|nr:c-type cytochrome domain-containing protein [Chryseolinea sp. H1M3-3]